MNRKNDQDTERLELHLEYLFESGINLKERVIRIVGDIDLDQFNLVDSGMSEMESYNRQAITIRICSEGGDVEPAMAIVGRLKNSPCKIITEGYGTIESAASLIFASGNERRISKYARFMHHEANYYVEGRHEEIKASVAQHQREEELWAQWLADFSKKSKKFYLEEAKHTDKYWTVEQLLEYGLADKVI